VATTVHPEAPIEVALLGASFGTANLGVSALATGSVSAVLTAFPGAKVILVDYAREASERTIRVGETSVEVETLNIRFSKKLYLGNNIAALLLLAILSRIAPKWLADRIISSNSTLRRLSSTSMALSLAGGDSFSDIYGFVRLLYVSLPQLLILFLKRPLILLPQTLGPFEGRGARILARTIMNRAAAVYARDRESLRYASSELGVVPALLRFSYDMALAMDPVQPERDCGTSFSGKSSGKTLVGFNVSGLLTMGGYTRNNMFGLGSDYAGIVKRLVSVLLEDPTVHVLLYSHVFGGDENDCVACKELYEQLPPDFQQRVKIVPATDDPQKIKWQIGRCDFFIGSRMHACIAALSQSVPAVSLAYSRKFAGVFESLGVEQLVIDLKTRSPDQVIQTVLELFRQRGQLHSELERTMPALISTVRHMFVPSGEKLDGNDPVERGPSRVPQAAVAN
jgi:colanic acid/amylovoran biosynthesis protein